jgi:SAM-dependent methyltransferase
MSTEAERIIEIYESLAEVWVDARLREANLYERGWLDRYCALLPPGGSVLDIGCGAGEPIARHFGELGYAVTGVDSSPSMIAMFRARHPDREAFVADMRTLCIPRKYNGILAWASFFHLNHADQRRMFPIFRAHAAPGAALMFTSGPEHGEVVGRLEGEPLYHASLDAREYRRLLENEGFTIVANVKEDQTCGGRTVWLAGLR